MGCSKQEALPRAQIPVANVYINFHVGYVVVNCVCRWRSLKRQLREDAGDVD